MAIEIINVIGAIIASFILGMIVHSAWLHSKERGEKPSDNIVDFFRSEEKEEKC